MNPQDQEPQDDFSPAALIHWLEAKYSRHGELEDKAAADFIRATQEPQRAEVTEMFREWLPRAYRDGDKGDEPKFTKHNMEAAYLAGAGPAKAVDLQDAMDALANYVPGGNRCTGVIGTAIGQDLKTVLAALATQEPQRPEPTMEQMKSLMRTLRHEDRTGSDLWGQSTPGEKTVAFKVLRAFCATRKDVSPPPEPAAARYGWLRARWFGGRNGFDLGQALTPDELDAAIDAAIAKGDAP